MHLLPRLSHFAYFLLISSILAIYPSCGNPNVAKGPARVRLVENDKRLQGRWVCDTMLKDGKYVDHRKVAGDVMIKFEGNKYTMSMAGEERTFTYAVREDLIEFTDVKNYPNLTVKSIAKGKRLVLDQYYPEQDFTIRWKMIPFKE